jgi:MinD superfamily P-loop ATPase
VLDLAAHFGVAALVAINKADLSQARTREIEAFCADEGIPIVGQIPYDTVVVEAMVEGLPVTAHTKGPVTQALQETWCIIKETLALV